jgi:hypothetical protein
LAPSTGGRTSFGYEELHDGCQTEVEDESDLRVPHVNDMKRE